jgi:hypothetical protein
LVLPVKEWEKQQARANWIELAYAADGRYKSDHPHHGTYTGLARGFCGNVYTPPPTEPYEDRWVFIPQP